ncbi:DUF523 domain-containing protein [Paenibacillus guangzhouensis]|uniref:DUF523 domain-containing protein n=1 Tax=Paenibacillus guangzhouensis TaxID=1473112 RepID=UPI0012671A41|nr:DUF523 domain-containing protein [Paenibacillus guangzhouensis]
MILVSSCLAGVACRYNGTHRLVDKIHNLVEQGQATMVCPELLGGFQTPREPAEIVNGTGEDVLLGKARILDRSGNDVTDLYLLGAQRTLDMARDLQATIVVLKEYSPSCGGKMVYDGHFSNTRVVGEGVTTALLRREGFQVISEEEFAATCE